MTRLLINETGNRYGRLTVLHRTGSALRQAGSKKGEALWQCLCDCSKEVVVRGSYLRDERTQSCGCLRSDRARERQSLPIGVAAFHHLVRQIKNSAKQRGHTFNLTDAQIKQLTSQPCHYCGKEPAQAQEKTTSVRCNGIYLHNGLDRIDNECGYEIDNVVTCCRTCNSAKLTMTIEEFKIWVCRIYEHFGSKP